MLVIEKKFVNALLHLTALFWLLGCASGKKGAFTSTPSQPQTFPQTTLEQGPPPAPSSEVVVPVVAQALRARFANTNPRWVGACIPIDVEFITTAGEIAPLASERVLVLNPGDAGNSVLAGFYRSSNSTCYGDRDLTINVTAGTTSVRLYFKSPKVQIHETALSMVGLLPPNPAFLIATEELPLLESPDLKIAGQGNPSYHDCKDDTLNQCHPISVPKPLIRSLPVEISFFLPDEPGLDVSLYQCRGLYSYKDNLNEFSLEGLAMTMLPEPRKFLGTLTEEFLGESLVLHNDTLYYGVRCVPRDVKKEEFIDFPNAQFHIQYKVHFY